MHIFGKIQKAARAFRILEKILLFRLRKQKWLEVNNLKEEIIPKLKAIIGQELKYNKLCEALELPNVGTRSKVRQLKELQLYCDFDILQKPTRYVIREVYEKESKIFEKINGNNKYQMMFDAVVYQTFLENEGKPIYVSTLDMLKLFSEVNENFAYTCSPENMMKLGEDFVYFTEMGRIAKKMLGIWTRNRIDSMVIRNFIVREKAYRLYSVHKGQYGAFRIRHDFNVDTDTGKICMAIMAQAIEEIVPEKYIQRAIEKNQEGEGIKDKILWMPLPIYNSFQTRIEQLVFEKFNGEYCDLKEIWLLKPPEDRWIYKKLTEIYKQLPALQEINTEACKKILMSSSSEFDSFTGAERKRFVEINMRLNPKISLQEKLKNK